MTKEPVKSSYSSWGRLKQIKVRTSNQDTSSCRNISHLNYRVGIRSSWWERSLLSGGSQGPQSGEKDWYRTPFCFLRCTRSVSKARNTWPILANRTEQNKCALEIFWDAPLSFLCGEHVGRALQKECLKQFLNHLLSALRLWPRKVLIQSNTPVQSRSM